MAFATIEDLEARWKPLVDDSERALAVTLLEDAGVYLARQVNVDETDKQQLNALKIVSCNIVKRTMPTNGADLFGVSQGTISADVYSQTFTYANPSGDFYLSKGDKSMLGINKLRVDTVRPLIDGYYGSNRND